MKRCCVVFSVEDEAYCYVLDEVRALIASHKCKIECSDVTNKRFRILEVEQRC